MDSIYTTSIAFLLLYLFTLFEFSAFGKLPQIPNHRSRIQAKDREHTPLAPSRHRVVRAAMGRPGAQWVPVGRRPGRGLGLSWAGMAGATGDRVWSLGRAASQLGLLVAHAESAGRASYPGGAAVRMPSPIVLGSTRRES